MLYIYIFNQSIYFFLKSEYSSLKVIIIISKLFLGTRDTEGLVIKSLSMILGKLDPK